jgi:hypothetical protein
MHTDGPAGACRGICLLIVTLQTVYAQVGTAGHHTDSLFLGFGNTLEGMQYLRKNTTASTATCRQCCMQLLLAEVLCAGLLAARPLECVLHSRPPHRCPQMHNPHSALKPALSWWSRSGRCVCAGVLFLSSILNPVSGATGGTGEQQTGHLHWLVELWGDLLVVWAGAALMPASSRWRQAFRTDCKDEPRRLCCWRQCSQAGWRTHSLTCTYMQAWTVWQCVWKREDCSREHSVHRQPWTSRWIDPQHGNV